MIKDLNQIEEILKSTDYYTTKRKIILLRANLKIKRNTDDIKVLKGEADTFFEKLNSSNPELSLIFYHNIKQFYEELFERYSKTGIVLT